MGVRGMGSKTQEVEKDDANEASEVLAATTVENRGG